mmetsp:Transcript_19730/g.45923  ORF Transcript_19730/g.45923 Transcript_19730/m.45923 type:complete len:285 (+) Transcript_19730:158-1012(+)
MKFTIATSCLFVATATFAVVSAEGTSLRGRSSALDGGLMESIGRATPVNNLRRHLEEVDEDADGENQAEEEDENVEDAEQGENAEEADADAEAEEEEEDEEEEEEENMDEDEEEQAEKEGDDYVFYDDLALQNCQEGDEDCEMAAKYAAYDDEYLANCGDDEECNDAAAYVTAKQKKEEEQNVGNKKWTDKYKSMPRTSQIWTIVLGVWFVVLVLTSFYLCCCRKSTPKEVSSQSSKRSLRQSLMGQKRKEETDDEQKRGTSKFRLFGRSSSKGKKSSSNGSFE